MRPGRAVAAWLAAAALGLLSWRDDVPRSAPAVWPAAVVVSAPSGGWICASRELARALRDEAFEWASSEDGPPPPVEAFTLVCTERDDASGQGLGGLELREPGKTEPVYTDAFQANRTFSRQDRERLARALAGRVASETSVAVAVERVYIESQNALAQAGASAFARGDWESAARLLFHGLEGLDDPAQAYYGLSAASARLGRPEAAYWYALAYAKTSASLPSAERLAYLKGLSPSSGLDAEAAGLYDEARRLVERGRFRQALPILKLAGERVPWDPRPADAVAQLYSSMGWGTAASRWRARAELARAVAADSRLKAALLASLR